MAQPWPPDPGESGSPALQGCRGGFGQDPGAGTLWDAAPSHPGPVENKVKEFLMKECLLRYTSVDRSQRSQAFISPLQGTSSLLWVMDRAKLCPPPPDLDTADPKTGEQGAGREGRSHSPIPRGCLAKPCCHTSFPARPLQPVLPHQGYEACESVYYGMAVLLGSGRAAGPGSAVSARYPEAAGGAGQAPQREQEEEEARIKEPATDRDKLKKQFRFRASASCTSFHLPSLEGAQHLSQASGAHRGTFWHGFTHC